MGDLSTDERTHAFAVDGSGPGCLLLHGFTGTPAEMRPIAERLVARGYSVRAPLLPGHGTRVEDLAATRWPEWFAAAQASWDELRERSAALAVVGLSMGALLALHLACQRAREVRAVVALAPAIRLREQRNAESALWMRFLPRLPRRFEIVPKRRKDPVAARITPAYDEIPLRALASMIELQRVVGTELPLVIAPALVLAGDVDETIAPTAAEEVQRALGSAAKQRLMFPRTGHIMTEDADAASVLAAVVDFLDENLRGDGRPAGRTKGEAER